MDENVLNQLLEDSNPEVKLRTQKEYLNLSDDSPEVIETKNMLLQSKVYERAL